MLARECHAGGIDEVNLRAIPQVSVLFDFTTSHELVTSQLGIVGNECLDLIGLSEKLSLAVCDYAVARNDAIHSVQRKAHHFTGSARRRNEVAAILDWLESEGSADSITIRKQTFGLFLQRHAEIVGDSIQRNHIAGALIGEFLAGGDIASEPITVHLRVYCCSNGCSAVVFW